MSNQEIIDAMSDIINRHGEELFTGSLFVTRFVGGWACSGGNLKKGYKILSAADTVLVSSMALSGNLIIAGSMVPQLINSYRGFYNFSKKDVKKIVKDTIKKEPANDNVKLSVSIGKVNLTFDYEAKQKKQNGGR